MKLSGASCTSQQDADATGLDASVRMELLRRHGDFTLAYSTATQPILNYFGDRHGYIAYGRYWGYVYAHGDPVAPRDRWPGLIREFLDAFPRHVFVQASEQTATTLNDAGLYINEMGTDTRLPLREYSLRGRKKEWLRHAGNWADKNGYRVEELPPQQWPADEVAEVSHQWRKKRTVSTREVQFLNRPLSFDDQPGVRRFAFRSPEGRMEAFVIFDPIYRDDRIVGYTASTKRRRDSAPRCAEQAIMRRAIEVFRQEELETLTLGLSPLASIEDGRFRCNPLVRFAFRYGYGAWWVNRFFYPLVAHAQYKRQYRGVEEKTYFCSNVLFNDFRVVGLLRMARVL